MTDARTPTPARRAMHEGRASRGQFWRLMALVWGIGLVYWPVEYVLFGGLDRGVRELLLVVIGLMLVLPALAMAIRRLHDLDYTGWLVLAAFVPFLGIAFLIVLGCLPGTVGPNRYGPDPLARDRGNPAPRTTGSDVAATPAPAAGARDVIAEVERLAQLKASGALSEAEFEAMKAQALRTGPVG